MKNLMKLGFMATLMGALVFFTGCDDNEIIIPDPTSEYDGEMEITEGNTSSLTIFRTDVADDATEIKALVTVTAAGDKMKRIYITENIAGTGEEPFELTGTDNKLDGSLDLENSAANEFQFELSLPIAGGITEGTVVYKIWATSGRGDYRDSSKRLLAGVGTLTINYGGTNPASVVKSYSAKILAAPRNDLASESFMSLADGQLYEIADGEEYAAFWDFGYFYTSNANFASTSTYETAFGSDAQGVPFIDVDAIAGTTELNNCYFAGTTMTPAEFEAIAVSSDLNGISVDTSSSQEIGNLAEGDIVAVLDNYGNKALIEVVEIYLGASGNGYDSDAYIKINVKVQP